MRNLDLGAVAPSVCIPVPKIIAMAALLAVVLGLPGCGGRSAFDGKGSPKYTGPDPIPIGGGVYKVGQPYQIAGKTYYPHVDPDYDKTGVASWYGPKFHRRMTANGEWFDQERITAAHNTMPLPSFARVTSLKNGKSIVVRVNDRGPYADNRIIDLSRRSAELLGIQRAGTGPVRVEYIGPAPLNGDDYYTVQAKLDGTRVASAGKQDAAWSEAQAATGHTGSVGRSVITPAGAREGLFVQAGAFGNPDNAARAQRQLASIGNVLTVETPRPAGTLYQVRVGPLGNAEEAGEVLARVIAAGHRDATVIEH